MKYIITTNEEVRIIEDEVRHCDVVAHHDEVLSAGFFRVDDDGVHCYGDSITLNKNSRGKEDDVLVSRTLKEGRYVLWKAGNPKIKALIMVPEDPNDYA